LSFPNKCGIITTKKFPSWVEEMTETIELKPDTNRQARHIFRGYAYQTYQTICAWLKCSPGEQLLTEFAEDLDLVRRDLDGNVTDAELNQIKHEKGAITLNSKAAVDLINNFFRHQKRNLNIKIFVHLCTISDRGKEKGIDWQYAECGMDLWDRLRNRELNGEIQNKGVHLLRSFLLSKSEFSEDVRSFASGSDNSTLLETLIDHIFWDTGQQAYGEIEDEIKRLLKNLPRPITDEEGVRQVIDRLWRHVTDVIASESTKTLTRENLERVLTQETSVAIDREIVKEVRSGIEKIEKSTSLIEGSIGTILERLNPSEKSVELKYPVTAFVQELPPLPKVCCLRTTIVAAIRNRIDHHLLTWIYGSTGYGKTVLANLLAKSQDRHCYWFGLREVTEFRLVSSLQIILSFVKTLEEKSILVIFDDVRIESQQTYCVELLHAIFNCLVEKHSTLLITSQIEPPERLKAMLDKEMCLFDTPEMSTSEISELIEAAGLSDRKASEFWSDYIYAATSGHPQLVIAYFVYLREKDWRFPSTDELFKKPRPVEQVKAESRKILAHTIKSEEARELARRLSLIVGTFERGFAIDVALSPPQLKEPGNAFDSLVGPWVEEIGSDLYVLSPLLAGYAEAEFGQAGLKEYYGIVSYAWLKKKSLTTLQIIQAITAGLLAKVEPLVAKICTSLQLADPEKIRPVAKELSILALFANGKDDSLADMDPMVRFMFRRMQLKVCEYNGDWATYSKIDDLAIKEINGIKSHPLYDEIYMVHCVDTSIRIDSSLKAKDRIDRTLSVLQMAYEKRETKRDGVIWNQKSLGEVLMVATQKITDVDDLEYLIDTVDKQASEIAAKVMSGFDTFPESLSLLIDRVWLFESEQQPPDWAACERVFLKAMEFGKKHKNDWLMAAVARGRMVIFDEYLNDPEVALKVAMEARSLIGRSHPLIDLGESTVFFRQRQYDRVLAIILDIEEHLPIDVLTLARVYGLSRALQSAANIKAWEEARRCASNGKKLSTAIQDELLSETVRIAFDAEMCLIAHFMGKFNEASMNFQKVLEDLEKFPNQEYQQFRFLRLKFGHTAAWASYTLGSESSALGERSESHLAKPSIGWFSNIEKLPEELMKRPAPIYPLTWSMVAMYAAWSGQREVVKTCARQATVRTQEGQYYLAVQKTWEALYASHINAREFDSAFYSGLEYARLFILGSECHKKESTWDPFKPMDLEAKVKELEPVLVRELGESVTGLVIEPLFMAICSVEELPKIDLQGWASHIEGILGREKDFASTLSWVNMGILAIFGDEAANYKIMEDICDPSKIPERIRRLAMLFRCVSKTLPLNDNLSAQSSMLLQIAVPFRGTIWAAAFYRMIAKRWMYMVESQRFMLASPSLSVPGILRLASIPNPTVSECASLLLSVAEGLNIRWPNELFRVLRELGKSR